MSDILIRNLPEATLARLKERARKRGVSLQAEVSQLLEQAARGQSQNLRDFFPHAKKIIPNLKGADLVLTTALGTAAALKDFASNATRTVTVWDPSMKTILGFRFEAYDQATRAWIEGIPLDDRGQPLTDGFGDLGHLDFGNSLLNSLWNWRHGIPR